MNEESRIERQLAREPRPELSPFFAARVTNELRRRERAPRRAPLLLRVYWLLLLAGAILAMHSVALQFDATGVSIVLVPVGFALWLYRADLGRTIVRMGELFFGSGG